jgi:hypothetical protein
MTRIIHPPFEGENLARANRPCPTYPNNLVQLVAATVLIGLAWFVACAADWSMPA